MAEVAKGVFVALNGVDLSCVLKKISSPATSDLKEATTLCATTNKLWEKGQLEHTISGEGFFRASALDSKLDANGLFKLALADKTADIPLMVCKDGASFGNIVQMYNVREAKYEVDLAINELLIATFEAKATRTATAEAASDGVILVAGTFNGTQTGATYDFLTPRTGFFMQTQITDGDNDVDFTVQHSTNGTNWVDLFGTGTGAPSAFNIFTTTSVVFRYVRINVSPEGISNTLVIGFKSGYASLY